MRRRINIWIGQPGLPPRLPRGAGWLGCAVPLAAGVALLILLWPAVLIVLLVVLGAAAVSAIWLGWRLRRFARQLRRPAEGAEETAEGPSRPRKHVDSKVRDSVEGR